LFERAAPATGQAFFDKGVGGVGGSGGCCWVRLIPENVNSQQNVKGEVQALGHAGDSFSPTRASKS